MLANTVKPVRDLMKSPRAGGAPLLRTRVPGGFQAGDEGKSLPSEPERLAGLLQSRARKVQSHRKNFHASAWNLKHITVLP